MILEAFADYLRSADPGLTARTILVRWLWERLTVPAQNNVDRVIRSEISLKLIKPNQNESHENLPSKSKKPLSQETRYSFQPQSASGRRLLESLYEYAMSYEQQKWSRWVHCVKASDFKEISRRD